MSTMEPTPPYTTPIPAVIMTPERVESSLGTFAIAALDADKQILDDPNLYKPHLLPDVPDNDSSAVTHSGPQMSMLLQTNQNLPSVGSQSEGFQQNDPPHAWSGKRWLPGKLERLYRRAAS